MYYFGGMKIVVHISSLLSIPYSNISSCMHIMIMLYFSHWKLNIYVYLEHFTLMKVMYNFCRCNTIMLYFMMMIAEIMMMMVMIMMICNVSMTSEALLFHKFTEVCVLHDMNCWCTRAQHFSKINMWIRWKCIKFVMTLYCCFAHSIFSKCLMYRDIY